MNTGPHTWTRGLGWAESVCGPTGIVGPGRHSGGVLSPFGRHKGLDVFYILYLTIIFHMLRVGLMS